MASIGLAANPSLYRKLAFDPLRDLAPISLLANSPTVLVVPPALPATPLAEFIAHLKAHPGELNYASYGAGTARIWRPSCSSPDRHESCTCPIPAAGRPRRRDGQQRADAVCRSPAGARPVRGGSSRRSRSPPTGARRCCPTCRPSAKAASTTAPAPGSACWRRRERRAASSQRCIGTPVCLRDPRCAPGSPSRAPTWSATRRRIPRLHQGRDRAACGRDPQREDPARLRQRSHGE